MNKSGLILVAQVLLVGSLATSALAMKCPLPSTYLNSLDLKPIEKYCAKGDPKNIENCDACVAAFVKVQNAQQVLQYISLSDISKQGGIVQWIKAVSSSCSKRISKAAEKQLGKSFAKKSKWMYKCGRQGGEDDYPETSSAIQSLVFGMVG